MNDDNLFDNGIDGEPFDSPADECCEEYYESSDVHIANGLEIQAWPTYGNYTITTNMFHVYFYPGANILEIYSLHSGTKYASGTDRCVLNLKHQDLSFFGEKELPDEDGKVNIAFYTGEQVNQKIQRYLNLRAFI